MAPTVVTTKMENVGKKEELPDEVQTAADVSRVTTAALVRFLAEIGNELPAHQLSR